MKLSDLLRHLRRNGCQLLRHGRSHDLWTNPETGEFEAIPRHTEIKNLLADQICRRLSILRIGRQ